MAQQRILAVDDDPSVTDFLRRRLAYEGYAVDVTNSGKASLDLAFLPYELVTTVAVSLHHPTSRRMGFSVEEQPSLPEAGEEHKRHSN